MARDTAPMKRAVDGVLDLVRTATEEIESSRRLPDAVVGALRGTGINRLLIPEALGGIEAPIVDVMDVMERIAAVDGSAGWCAAIGAGSNVFAGYLPAAGARTVFADPDQGNATMFAPVGRVVSDQGRAVLTGRWPFTSNCLHSAWAGLGALFHEADGLDPVPRVVFVPMSDLQVEDTWDVVGLRGTGSHHVTAAEVAIDRERCARFSDRPWPEGTLWRLPIYTTLLPTLVAVPIGIARGAVDEIARQTREGRTARRGQLADAPISPTPASGRSARGCGRRSARRVHLPSEASRSAGSSRPASTWRACMRARRALR
jgi:indole-3-acetate monooxygenase